MIDPQKVARAVAEKNRMDPPPPGKVWSLGWDQEGGRVPLWDALVDVAPTVLVGPIDLGLDPSGDENPGYDYGAAGSGVRSTLIDAGLARLANLDATYEINTGLRSPVDTEDAAARVLAQVGTARVFEVRNLVRLVALAVLEQLSTEVS